MVPEEQGGLAPGARMADNDRSGYCIQLYRRLMVTDLCSDSDDQQFKARRNVRATNFTGQTNALDVNKHMYDYWSEAGIAFRLKLH